jgi:hypothetical protein
MKLAEALTRRGNLQKRIEILKDKIIRYSRVQEGEEPPENPEDIYTEIENCFEEFTGFVKSINKTNSVVLFDDKMTISDALAHRDTLLQKYRLLSKLIESATDIRDRYSRKEFRILSSINVKEYQKEADKAAKEFRELDIRIQEKNWLVDSI